MANTVPKLRPVLKRRVPNLRVERRLWEVGHEVVVGVACGRDSRAGVTKDGKLFFWKVYIYCIILYSIKPEMSEM